MKNKNNKNGFKVPIIWKIEVRKNWKRWNKVLKSMGEKEISFKDFIKRLPEE